MIRDCVSKHASLIKGVRYSGVPPPGSPPDSEGDQDPDAMIDDDGSVFGDAFLDGGMSGVNLLDAFDMVHAAAHQKSDSAPKLAGISEGGVPDQYPAK